MKLDRRWRKTAYPGVYFRIKEMKAENGLKFIIESRLRWYWFPLTAWKLRDSIDDRKNWLGTIIFIGVVLKLWISGKGGAFAKRRRDRKSDSEKTE